MSSRLRYFVDKWELKRPKGTWLFPSPWGKRWAADNFSQDLRAANEKVKLPWGALDYHRV